MEYLLLVFKDIRYYLMMLVNLFPNLMMPTKLELSPRQQDDHRIKSHDLCRKHNEVTSSGLASSQLSGALFTHQIHSEKEGVVE